MYCDQAGMIRNGQDYYVPSVFDAEFNGADNWPLGWRRSLIRNSIIVVLEKRGGIGVGKILRSLQFLMENSMEPTIGRLDWPVCPWMRPMIQGWECIYCGQAGRERNRHDDGSPSVFDGEFHGADY